MVSLIESMLRIGGVSPGALKFLQEGGFLVNAKDWKGFPLSAKTQARGGIPRLSQC